MDGGHGASRYHAVQHAASVERVPPSECGEFAAVARRSEDAGIAAILRNRGDPGPCGRSRIVDPRLVAPLIVESREPHRSRLRVGAAAKRRRGALTTSIGPQSRGVEAQPIGLCSGFFRWAAESPDRPALEIEGDPLAYGELARRARAIAAMLLEDARGDGPPLTAVLAHRSATAFAGVLGALARGDGYVPLNPAFPPARNRAMLDRSGCEAVIVDSAARSDVSDLLEGLDRELLLVLPDEQDVEPYARQWKPHRVVGAREPGAADVAEPLPVRPDDPAYLLFTSGSTGIPKGVAVSHANVRAFLDAVAERYDFSGDDRFSQTFNLTFDLSVFDMFAAWECGACVCCPSDKSLLNPADFIRRSEITVWFSVPSIGLFMRRLRVLKPASFPTLRWSLFCGEALPEPLAREWSEAAPGSTVENLYGPTEATIACTAYRWDSDRSPDESELGLVPIGHPLGAMSTLVAGDDRRQVGPGEAGELLLSGPQVVRGYWNDDEATSRAFVSVGGRSYYRTGDRVRRPSGDGPLRYLGRLDNQIKVLGHRVELGEVEAAIREETGVDAVVALGWPRSGSGAAGIAAFVADTGVDSAALRAGLARRLPGYMVPRELRLVSELPINANGKWDREALIRILDEG
jgi:amino acid adenylation domain-containing protein